MQENANHPENPERGYANILKMMIFKYHNWKRSDGTLRKAPIIPVYAQSKNGRLLKIFALVDSGADMSLMPKDLALLLGLNEKDTETGTTAGIGGEIEVKKANFSFVIKNEHEKYDISLVTLVMQNTNLNVPPILGRNGFFEQFHITFKQNEEKIILKKVQPKDS